MLPRDPDEAPASLRARAASALVFPGTLGAALLATWVGFARLGMPPGGAAALAILAFGFLAIPLFERLLPYRADWNASQGDVGTDLTHLTVSTLIQYAEKPLLVALLVGATGWAAERFGGSAWPHHWPLAAQLVLMLLVAEFGRYWVHVAAHKVPWLWRFHAVHHSPRRLYAFNANRFHPVEKIFFQLPEIAPFIVLGTNAETLALYFTLNSVRGLFQHSNVRVRLGPLNYVFAMSEVHRWHHSRRIHESDTNYGNNLIVWDLVFGTFFWPKDRTVGEVGLLNPDFPTTYVAQLAAPFADRDLSKPLGYVPERAR